MHRDNNSINLGREVVKMNPHARYQSNKEPLNKADNWVLVVSISSNTQQVFSFSFLKLKIVFKLATKQPPNNSK